MKVTTAIAAVIAAAFALPALAQSTPNIDQRQAVQQQRIEQGVASGELTQKEAAKLEQGQVKVERMEEKAKSDGTVTAQERARLHHAQDKQSRRIRHEKHDRQHDRNHDGMRDRPRAR